MNNHHDETDIDAELDGYARHNGATLITYRDGDTFGVVRVSDDDALAGAPATVFAAGTFEEVNAAVAALGIDPYAAAQEDRPDGASFIAVGTVMYVLAQLADEQFALIELTDYDFIEGEYAKIVFTTDNLADARGAFSLAVTNRRAGRPPIAGRLGITAVGLLNAAIEMAVRSGGAEFVVRERCSNCGASLIVGAPHHCRNH